MLGHSAQDVQCRLNPQKDSHYLIHNLALVTDCQADSASHLLGSHRKVMKKVAGRDAAIPNANTCCDDGLVMPIVERLL